MASLDIPEPVSNEPPKRLVLCFDGTGNQFNANETDSNIVKIYEMLDRTTADQYHYYQPGIGTYEEGKLTNATTQGWYSGMKTSMAESTDQMFGTSFVNHVLGGYQFLLRYYAPGDKIYIFGFSRGAYTARFLSEMIDNIGLLSRGNDVMIRFAWDTFSDYQRLGGKLNGDVIDDDAMDNIADDYDSDEDSVYTQFRRGTRRSRLNVKSDVTAVPSDNAHDSAASAANNVAKPIMNSKVTNDDDSDGETLLGLGKDAALYTHGAGRPPATKPKDKKQAKEYMDIFRSTFCRSGVKVYFLGLFDCVNSVAQFDVHKGSSPYIPRAPARHIRHALSIHERRANFRPSLFLLDPTTKTVGNVKTLEEVWFAGNHGDVGGGWWLNSAKDKYLISDLALKWMVEEVRKLDSSKRNKLIWHEDKVQWLQQHVHKQSRSWDPKSHKTDEKAKIANSSAQKRLHDPLAYGGGLKNSQVFFWRFLETLPFSRWEYVKGSVSGGQASWVSKWMPANYGAARDIPDGSRYHISVKSMIENQVLLGLPQSRDETKVNWLVRFGRFIFGKELQKPKSGYLAVNTRWTKDADDLAQEPDDGDNL